jgi:pimeloyl-ACP methyl ester carboxylesterase
MRPERTFSRPATALALSTQLLALASCGGGGGNGLDTLPQLAAATPAALVGTCDELAGKLANVAGTRITSTTLVPAGTLKEAGKDIPAHCLVNGRMHERVSPVDGKSYAIGFEMRLPLAWNGRFFYQGNGGLDGAIIPALGEFGGGPTTGALAQGFAVISSDAGHTNPTDFSFGIDPQARLDYGYQAVGSLTPMAKEVIRVAYGKAPDRSYIGGCSNGGRHAMVAAARYPDQYDGFIAGAPGFNLPKASINSISKGQHYLTVATNPADLSTAFTVPERAMVAQAILAKCDALDGAVDGLVQDTGACQAAFDLQRDVPTCTGARDGTCLSPAQKSAIASVFGGVVLSNGTHIYASQPWDPGLSSAGLISWHFQSPVGLSAGNTGIVLKVPPENPAGFDTRAFSLGANLDTLWAQVNATNATYTESAMSFMTPPNPTDLGRLKNRGAKMIVYQGVSDPVFMVTDTMAWYDGLKGQNGGDASSFARLFRVPGMSHCSSGPSTDQIDPLTAIVAWVEQGRAPDVLIATARGPGNPGGVNTEVPASWSANRTRPLCPYPKVARYNGSGSLEDAANFSCK